MTSRLGQALIGLSSAAVLIGCATTETKADLMGSLIADGKPQEQRLSPAPAGIPGRTASAAQGTITFSFHAFGDSGWAQTHVSRPAYNQGFQRAYRQFDPNRSLLGDVNYINWETSVGQTCDAFWSAPSSSTYAFLSRPEDLVDAIRLGFNLVGLANNHSFDCLRSAEGLGPLQTYGHLEAIRRQFAPPAALPLFSGVFSEPDQEPASGTLRGRHGQQIPVSFLSAYVGGDPNHCRNIVCDQDLEQYQEKLTNQRGLRVLALHSWDKGSHGRLKAILQSWLQQGRVDVAIGSGPHIAEDVRVVTTPRGAGVLATSLGNFIHPSLARQPYNIALLTNWRLHPASGRVQLLQARRTIIGCDAETCRKGRTATLWSSGAR